MASVQLRLYSIGLSVDATRNSLLRMRGTMQNIYLMVLVRYSCKILMNSAGRTPQELDEKSSNSCLAKSLPEPARPTFLGFVPHKWMWPW